MQENHGLGGSPVDLRVGENNGYDQRKNDA